MERVAIYGRVADHRDGMMRQKAQLMQRLSGIIQAHSDWTYSGAYIDTGNSHEQLELLLERCRDLDHLLIPAVKDLALRRDDLYATLNEMHSLGIMITFIDDNIDTSGENGEELLFALASFLKPPKAPKVILPPYGIGDEDEADVVRRIFQLFLSGHGRTPIAATLTEKGIAPPNAADCGSSKHDRILSTNTVERGSNTVGHSSSTYTVECGSIAVGHSPNTVFHSPNDRIPQEKGAWTYCDVRRILTDPVYVNEQIIDEATWNAANAEQEKRTRSYGRRPASNSHLSGLITCGVCGNHFIRRERGKSSIWLCKTYLREGRAACPSRCIREKLLLEIMAETEGTLDNITVWPDGRLTIHTESEEIEKQWRSEVSTQTEQEKGKNKEEKQI